MLPEGLLVLWREVFPFAYGGTAALTVVLGSISPFPVNLFVNRMAARRRTAERTSDHVGLIIDRALTTNKLVQVALDDRKIYTGRPLHRPFNARGHDGDLDLIPLWSSHRDVDTLEPQAPTNYAPVIKKALDAGGHLEDFSVAIPLSTVQSVRIFDPDLSEP